MILSYDKIMITNNWEATKCGADRICGADLYGDNLRGSVCGSVPPHSLQVSKFYSHKI